MRARRRWRHKHRAQPKELVCLNHDRKASTALLMPPHLPRRGQPEDLAANHRSGQRRSKLRHLLPDHAHLLAIIRIGTEAPDLLHNRRAHPPSRRRLPQRRPHRLGIAQATGTNHVKRSRSAVIETDVKGTCRHAPHCSADRATRQTRGGPTADAACTQRDPKTTSQWGSLHIGANGSNPRSCGLLGRLQSGLQRQSALDPGLCHLQPGRMPLRTAVRALRSGSSALVKRSLGARTAETARTAFL
jgi:hypothetical protein